MQRLQQVAAARGKGCDQPAFERSAARLRLVPYSECQLPSGRTVLGHVIVGQPLAVAPQAHNVDEHQIPNDRDLVGSCWRKFVVPVMPRVYPDGDANPRKNVTEALVGATVEAMELERNAAENGRDARFVLRG